MIVVEIFWICFRNVGVEILVFLTFLVALDDLESSGRLVGFVSTYSGTSPTPWRRVMSKNAKKLTSKKATTTSM